MKTKFYFSMVLLVAMATGTVQAQQNNALQMFDNDMVNTLIVNSIGDVHVVQGDSIDVACSDETLADVRMQDSCIYISGISDFDVTLPELTYLFFLGTGDIKVQNGFSGSGLFVLESGIGDVELDLNYGEVYLRVLGPSDMKLYGSCNTLMADMRGPAELNAGRLSKELVLTDVTGPCEVSLGDVESALIYYKSYGATLKGKAKEEIRLSEPIDIVSKEDGWHIAALDENTLHADSKAMLAEAMPFFRQCRAISDNKFAKEGWGKMAVKIADRYRHRKGDGGMDGDKQYRGNTHRNTNGYPKAKERHYHSRFMDCQWAGFEAGLNMLVDPMGNDIYTGQQDLMALRPLRSWYFGYNIADIGIAFDRKHTMGIFTGIGLGWNNYRWKNPIQMKAEGNTLVTTLLPDDPEWKVKKSKLGVMYLQMPLMLEAKPTRSLFVDLGVTGGLRLASWTKIKYENGSKTTTYDKYTLNLFKLDANLRIGGDNMGFFVNYALIPAFADADAKKAHPLSVGFSLIF